MAVFAIGNWRFLAARGVVALLFGILALLWPDLTVTALVLLFGAFVLIDGIASLALVAGSHRGFRGRRGAVLLEGIASVLIGAITFAWPGITALALLWLIAAWAIITGVLEIRAAVLLRRQLRYDWVLGLIGVLSVLFGIVLVITPGEGALVITWVIGWYAVMAGVLLLYMAWRIHKHHGGTQGIRPAV